VSSLSSSSENDVSGTKTNGWFVSAITLAVSLPLWFHAHNRATYDIALWNG
jgi:hypothetical protein